MGGGEVYLDVNNYNALQGVYLLLLNVYKMKKFYCFFNFILKIQPEKEIKQYFSTNGENFILSDLVNLNQIRK